MDRDADVIIVGAGPVGLLAAIELTLAGASVLVLERLDAPSQASKALGIGPLGIEALQRRGMAAAIAAAQARAIEAMKPFVARHGPYVPDRGERISGHFAGLSLIRSDAQTEPERRSRPVDQQAVEAMLADRAAALGIEVWRGCEVVDFTARADRVEVTVRAPAGERRLCGAYLLGCDGGRSRIRKLARFAFPGSAPSMTMYTARVAVDHPQRLAPAGWHRTDGGVFAYGPFPERLFMLDFSGPPADREAPVTREEIEAVLRRVSGADVRVETLAGASRWTDNTRLVDSYRQGRILLAGDAAHVHAPFGGQGLNLGLVDAANLGWKLAAVVRGDMPESLLDSYTRERRPAAKAVLANTLAQMAIMRPDPQSGAMREMVAKLMRLDEVNRVVGQMTSGLSTRYESAQDRDDVGRLVGDMPLAAEHGEVSLYALMQRGEGVFLDAASPGGEAGALVAAVAPGLRCVAVGTGPSLLIRPDACVAWAGDGDDTHGLQPALRRWFGAVAEHPRMSSLGDCD